MHPQPSNRFSEVFSRHRGNGADKWEGYLRLYDEVLGNRSSSFFDVLEIGVNNGGSLEIWGEYFPYARSITGVDINPKCESIPFQDPRIQVVIGDSNTPETRELLQRRAESFDLILDDGSHQSVDIISTFINLVGLVSPGGTYIIEDLCCSYWQEFGGGVRTQSSAIAFLKTLVDVVNLEHWNSPYSLVEYLEDCGFRNASDQAVARLSTIKGISFYNSICVVDFAKVSAERLIGKRMCRGTQFLAGYAPVNGQDINEVGADQSANPLNRRQSTSA